MQCMISKSNVKFTDSEVRTCQKYTVSGAMKCLSLFALRQCTCIKQSLDSLFVISEIIKVLVSVISLSLRLRLITLTSTLIIPDITKTSSNNCIVCQPITTLQIEYNKLMIVHIIINNRPSTGNRPYG